MVFKRRRPRSTLQILVESLWPKGGWSRAARYVWHRLRRLPDPAHRISLGIASGVFVCFTPLYGLHFLTAAGVAWLIRGNILASLLSTFFGNPLTFPIIATISMNIGTWILGRPSIPFARVFRAFSNASVELWANFQALFTPASAEWSRLWIFFDAIFLPYMIGGLVPGFIAAAGVYYLANPVIASYQRGRIHALKERFEQRRRLAAEAKKSTKAKGARPSKET